MRLRHKPARPTLIALAPTLAAATAHATIVTDHDLFKISPYDIHQIGVLETWGGRRQVWQKK